MCQGGNFKKIGGWAWGKSVTTQQGGRFGVQESFVAFLALHFDDFIKIDCEKRYQSR